jgi:hypothetical protein
MKNPETDPVNAARDIREKYLPNTRIFLAAKRPPSSGAEVCASFSAHDLMMFLGCDLPTVLWCLSKCNREALVTRSRNPSRGNLDSSIQFSVPAHGKTLQDIPAG